MSIKQDQIDLTKWIIYVVLMIGALSIAGWAWKYNTATVRGVVDAEVRIESGDNRIYSYENFFDQCASIQGYEQALVAQKEVLAQAKGDEAVHIRATIAAITAQRARAIMQYNVDAAKAYTKARFFDDQLPRKLTVEGTTSCAL